MSRLLQPQKDGGIQPVFVVAVALLFFALGLIFPYTGDDWAWGSFIGMDRLENDFFTHYDGRYVGDLFALLLTRSVLARAICVALCETYIVYGGYTFVNKSKRWMFWLMLVLVLFMYHEPRSECIVWTSGLVSYSIPMAGFVGWMNIIKGSFGQRCEPLRGAYVLPLFLLGLILSLFVETITICVLAAAVAMVLYVRAQHRLWDGAQIAYLVGAATGAIIMFSNETYLDPNAAHSIASFNDAELIVRAVGKMAYEGCVMNFALNVAFAAAVFLMLAEAKRGKRGGAGGLVPDGAGGGKRILLLRLLAFGAMLLVVYSAYRSMRGGSGRVVRYLDGLPFAFFLAATFILAIIVWRSRRNHTALFLLGCCVALTAPLLVVTPVTWRCFFPAYLLLCVYVLSLLDGIDVDGYLDEGLLLRVLMGLSAVGFAVLFVIYGIIFSVYSHRASDIQAQLDAGQTTIALQRLPLHEHIQHHDKSVETNVYTMGDCFHYYYGIPLEYQIVFYD